jgi:hypothetical protein
MTWFLCPTSGAQWEAQTSKSWPGAFDALPSGGLVLVRDFMVDNAYERPPFAAWYLLGSIFDNPNAVCLTPAYVEQALRQAGFQIDATEVMLPGITMLTKARKPG